MAAATNKTAGDKTTDTSAGLSAQIDTMRAELGALTKSVADMGVSQGDYAITAARVKAAEARDVVADQAETARLHAMELQDQATDFVRTQPMTALGIAAGFGFLVGFLGSRK